MTVELNIGLDAPRYRDNRMTRAERFNAACAWVVRRFVGAQIHHVKAGPDHEHVLVVRGQEADLISVLDVYSLCEQVNQDCIAARMGFNVLIGPKALHYQPFDIAKFITMEQAMYPLHIPAQHQTDTTKAPGQVVNPIPPSMLYKPAHGGYPGHVPTNPAERQGLKIVNPQ